MYCFSLSCSIGGFDDEIVTLEDSKDFSYLPDSDEEQEKKESEEEFLSYIRYATCDAI